MGKRQGPSAVSRPPGFRFDRIKQYHRPEVNGLYLPQLNPVAIHIGPLAVHWYGIFMILAILGGSWYLVERGRELGEDPDWLTSITFWTVVAGVVGARLVFVLANDPQWIWQDPMQTLRVWQGGLAFDGAVGLGILALWYQLRKKPLVFNHLADWTVPGIALGIFMVRIGNIFNHEVLGRMTELGFGRWPEQLWGSFIGVFLITRYFWLERNRPVPPGYQFWSAMFYYALLRGVIGETTRDNPLYLVHYLNPHWGIGFTTLMQLFTPPILVFTGIMMRRTWRRSAIKLPDAKVPAWSAAELSQNVLPGRLLMVIFGGLAALGGIIFFLMGIPEVGWYLLVAGLFLAASTMRWGVRFRHVLATAPAGYEPTGEAYLNPGGEGPVTVWHRGIRRAYVQWHPDPSPRDEEASRP